jgi:hypothetical protein
VNGHWDLVQRIANSEQFTKSPKVRDFLLYVCRALLEERVGDINEQRIGERVFGRAENYNPSEDNIVRSQARILRQKLETYFASEGAHEPFVLQIPKGGYVPELVERCSPVKAVPLPSLPMLAPARKRWINNSNVALAALSLAVIGLAWALIRAKENPVRPVSDAPSKLVFSLWSQLFNDKMATTIVVPDHTFALMREASGQPLDLQTYLKRSIPQETDGSKHLNDLFRFPQFADRRYTTFDSVSSAVRLKQLAEKFPNSRVAVRYARDITLRDVSPGHVIFIGRPFSNPWEDLFEAKLNFRCQVDPKLKQWVWWNAAPRPGEQTEYVPERGPRRIDTYASVAFVSNLSKGNVVILAGSNSGSQESAADFTTTERLLAKLAAKIGQPQGRFPHFDALLRTTTIDGVSQEPALVAFRTLD